MAEPNWDDFPNFTRAEFECRCGCGRADMDPIFMDRLQDLRTFLGFPLPVNSGFRCEAYNASIGGGVPHPTGQAADLSLYGDRAFELVFSAARHGFRGIGLMQHGPHNERFIHLDTLKGDLRPWVWTYA